MRERDDIMIIKAGSGFYFHAPRILCLFLSVRVCMHLFLSNDERCGSKCKWVPRQICTRAHTLTLHTMRIVTQPHFLLSQIVCWNRTEFGAKRFIALSECWERFCIKLLLQFLLQSRYFKVSGAKGEPMYAPLFAFGMEKWGWRLRLDFAC